MAFVKGAFLGCMTNTSPQLQEALSHYKQGISLPEARFHVGRCHDFGIGTDPNKVLALKWYKQVKQQWTCSNNTTTGMLCGIVCLC